MGVKPPRLDGQDESRARKTWLNPLSLLKDAIRAVPSVRYALGVVGIAAAVSIISILLGDHRVAIIGMSCAIAFMVVLLVFQRLSLLDRSHFKVPALILLWFFPLVLVAFLSLLLSSVFFGWPLSLKQWLEGAQRDSRELPSEQSRLLIDLSVSRGQAPFRSYRLTTVPVGLEGAPTRGSVQPVGFYLWPEVDMEQILFAIRAGGDETPPEIMTQEDFVGAEASTDSKNARIWKVFETVGSSIIGHLERSDTASLDPQIGSMLATLPREHGEAGIAFLRPIYYREGERDEGERKRIAGALISLADRAMPPQDNSPREVQDRRIYEAARFLATKQLSPILTVSITNAGGNPVVVTGVGLEVLAVSRAASALDSGPLAPTDTLRFDLDGREQNLVEHLGSPVKIAAKDAISLQVDIRSKFMFSYLCRLSLLASGRVLSSTDEFIVTFGFQPPDDASAI